jgi:hypothetical protein
VLESNIEHIHWSASVVKQLKSVRNKYEQIEVAEGSFDPKNVRLVWWSWKGCHSAGVRTFGKRGIRLIDFQDAHNKNCIRRPVTANSSLHAISAEKSKFGLSLKLKRHSKKLRRKIMRKHASYKKPSSIRQYIS